MNAFWSRHEVVFVERREGAIRLKRVLAEHSCFVRKLDMAPELVDRLKRHVTVVDIRDEGAWWRACFAQRDDCLRFCDAMHRDGVDTFEGGVNPVLRAMVDRDIKPANPRTCWTDIESDSRVPFSRKEEMRILCWAVVGDDGREFTGCLRSNCDAAEKDLLTELWAVLDQYDQVAAWSGDRFDFPVIHARTERHGLFVEVRRWLWLDHLELFRRMNMSSSKSGDEKQSMKLNTVAMALLGEGKDEFAASKTWEVWAAGGAERRRLVAYCLQDTRLMPRIEDKTGYIKVLRTMGDFCGTFSDSRGVNPTTQVEGFLQRLAMARGYKFPTKHHGLSAGQFKGAYVMPPRTSGIERHVHVCDFKSLYPSIIVTWNMSPETRVPVDGDHEGCALSPLTGEWFTQTVEGVLAVAVGQLMKLRDEWKAKKKAAPPGTPAWDEADRRSTAYKIATNSFYGVIGVPNGRFHDRAVAESVTQCGVMLVLKTIEAAEARGMRVVYADTDSCFVTGVTEPEFKAFVDWCNESLYPGILAELGCAKNDIKLAYEKEYDRLIMTTAKKYAANYVHYDGKRATADSEPEIKGLEFKRGDSLSYARQLQEAVVHRLVGYKCDASEIPQDFEAILQEHYTRLMNDPIELQDVLISKRLNQPLEGYARKMLKDGSGFARQLPHIELARLLLERGYDMAEGAKVDYVVINPEDKPLRIVAAVDWDAGCEIDRGATWRALVVPPTIRLLTAAFPSWSWESWETIGKLPKVRKARTKTAS